ncbi:hypothetical protein ACFU6S_44440 [Streptomyces sp. NPDC057456]|uniref:hypothetical protein n=1 Tax=Streptomyces sp. NPDC057456 TaxID=3346139 RepID=UPI0036842226
MIDSMPRTRPTRAAQDADHRLGQHLLNVVRRQDAAIPAFRRAPRTVAEMRARLAAVGAAQNDRCPLCEYWTCRCTTTTVQAGPALVPVTASGGGQCSWCRAWFPDWIGGVCDACRAAGH